MVVSEACPVVPSTEDALMASSPSNSSTEKKKTIFKKSKIVSKRPNHPPSRSPARRIITLMGIVCLICSLIVVGIVVLAVLLSETVSTSSSSEKSRNEIIYLVPRATHFNNRPRTIVIHRQNKTLSKQQFSELTELINNYNKEDDSASSLCNKSKSGSQFCSFPVSRISKDCSAQNSFGYNVKKPCVALVFQEVDGWVPVPYKNTESDQIPDQIADDYDSSLLYMTCVSKSESHEQDILLSPYQGFPLRHFPARNVSPPMVMLQILNPPIRTDILVTCRLWASNIIENTKYGIPGNITFSLWILSMLSNNSTYN
ncbi:sodium/potassium-transporting ATPase subunit beta-like [Limulus polyphemus]|uniref:Sodium/potassium-transporting ATPase subunit beta-like n=1 Tax=Limulus polyphemus TaxID=6850 RepID=A0ABM1B9Y6_LIMPO|nr:sodium/potassium-transporting ATPase subunit beta-like [Limulus polyphemus]